jgi:hypothetical protein
MSCQNFSSVWKPCSDVFPPVLVEDDRTDFGIPENLEPLALSIVGDAR